MDGTYIDEALGGSQSDRLFQVKLTSGKTALLYVLLEHKSSPDPRTPIQILGYMARIWERYAQERLEAVRALPPIIPLVLYHGRRRWTVPTSVLDCIDVEPPVSEYVREFAYHLCDLRDRSDDELAGEPVVRAVLMALKHGAHEEAPHEVLVRILRELPDGTLLETQTVRYILLAFRQITRDGWRRIVEAAKPAREDDLVSIAAEEWRQQGKAEREADEARALAGAVIGILEDRFGTVDTQRRARVTAMSAEELRPLVRKAATTTSVQALLPE